MATRSIIDFRRDFPFRPPVLEIGSKMQPGYEQFSPRELHNGGSYLGIDIEPGEGVDVVADVTTSEGRAAIIGKFRTIHCHCVLEHVPDVFRMARVIEELLEPGGHLFVSVPFVWRIHRIPVDMWRFTPQGLDYLFPHIEFLREHCAFSTRREHEYFDLESAPELRPEHGLAYKVLRKLGNTLLDRRALLPESNLMMIGVRRPTRTFTFMPS